MSLFWHCIAFAKTRKIVSFRVQKYCNKIRENNKLLKQKPLFNEWILMFYSNNKKGGVREILCLNIYVSEFVKICVGSLQIVGRDFVGRIIFFTLLSKIVNNSTKKMKLNRFMN